MENESIQAESQEKDTSVTACEPAPQRIYEIWPGQNRFFLSGRVMIGPKRDQKAFVFTWVCLLAISLFFFAVATPYLWYEASPVIPLAAVYFFVLSVVFLTLTTVTDPGIIPRRNVLKAIGVEAKALTMVGDSKRWCKTCEINRPPRTSHCRHCDNCIEVMDHHCPFVSNCIGKNNYRFFIAFLVHVTALGFIYIIGFITHIINERKELTEMTPRTLQQEETITDLCICLIALPVMVLIAMVTMLCVFHMRICAKGETTKEVLRGTEEASRVGFRLCGQSPPTMFSPRMLVTN